VHRALEQLALACVVQWVATLYFQQLHLLAAVVVVLD
jgi:hypothetical protein